MLDATAILAKIGIHRLRPPSHSTVLEEISEFGFNPGNLRMFRYVPGSVAPKPALMVVLHGCTQSAASYDAGTGWSRLAERYGFSLLFPEQQRANNPNGCFNWFQPADVQRGRGEVASIKSMIDRCQRDQGTERVFITGLSAGGAMTSAMLACYPEMFAGGAIIAGLPFGGAGDVRQAFEMMSVSPSRPAEEWGNLVRRASRHSGPWPRISIWHGGADTTVVPANAKEILKQWMNVHGVSDASMSQGKRDGIPRLIWKNQAGDEVIEFYNIPHMAHGTPLATGSKYGEVAGPFMLETGISSSYQIANFFGLIDLEILAAAAAPHIALPERKMSVPSGAFAQRSAASKRIDVGAVIADALKAAGLR